MDKMRIEERDLVEKPGFRVPVCLVLDRSGSMSGDPIRELNEGVKQFFDETSNDEATKDTLEVSIVTFGDQARVELDFGSLQRQNPPVLSADGGTSMGAAVNLSLDILTNRKATYKKLGVEYRQPWMVLMTDGKPTDEIEEAASKTSKLSQMGILTIFAVGIGKTADMNTLARFSPNRPPLKMKGLKFKEFFEFLRQSMEVVSKAQPDQDVTLDEDWLKSWVDIPTGKKNDPTDSS